LSNFGLLPDSVEFFLQNPKYDNIFSKVTESLKDKKSYKLASNYISTVIAGLEKNKVNPKGREGALGYEEGKFENFTAENIVDLISMINDGELSSRGAKDVLGIIYQEKGDTKKIAEEKGFIQKSDPEELKKILEKILEENPTQVEGYKNGEEKLLQFFVGQGMKATKGSANPGLLTQLLKELLK